MHALMISVCTLVAVPGQSGVSTSAVAQQLPVSRSSIELRTAVRDTMRREAMAATFADRSKAIRELCEIFVEIATGDAMNDTLRDRYLGKVRSRLRRTQRDLEIQVARDRRSESRSAPQTDVLASVPPATGSPATLSRGGAAAGNGPGAGRIDSSHDCTGRVGRERWPGDHLLFRPSPRAGREGSRRGTSSSGRTIG